MAVYFAVTPSDATVLNPPVTSLYIGVAGDVAILGATDTVAVTLKAAAVGWMRLPSPAQKVMATNTAATNIVASTG